MDQTYITMTGLLSKMAAITMAVVMLAYHACANVPPPQDNVTTILNQLLNGYDNRIRPGFGGKYLRGKAVYTHLVCLNMYI